MLRACRKTNYLLLQHSTPTKLSVKATVTRRDQQSDAAAEGADVIVRSVDVYDVVSVCVGGGGGRC